MTRGRQASLKDLKSVPKRSKTWKAINDRDTNDTKGSERLLTMLVVRRLCDARACGHTLMYEINWPTRPYWFLVHLHVVTLIYFCGAISLAPMSVDLPIHPKRAIMLIKVY